MHSLDAYGWPSWARSLCWRLIFGDARGYPNSGKAYFSERVGFLGLLSSRFRRLKCFNPKKAVERHSSLSGISLAKIALALVSSSSSLSWMSLICGATCLPAAISLSSTIQLITTFIGISLVLVRLQSRHHRSLCALLS